MTELNKPPNRLYWKIVSSCSIRKSKGKPRQPQRIQHEKVQGGGPNMQTCKGKVLRFAFCDAPQGPCTVGNFPGPRSPCPFFATLSQFANKGRESFRRIRSSMLGSRFAI